MIQLVMQKLDLGNGKFYVYVSQKVARETI